MLTVFVCVARVKVWMKLFLVDVSVVRVVLKH